MKIVHLCLSCFFIDGRAYQENELVEEHARQGHEVLVIASTHVHGDDGKRAFTRSGNYRDPIGFDIVRLDYHPLLPKTVAKSIRAHKGVYKLIDDFAPDVIMFHGMCGWELITVSHYKRRNPEVLLYVDNHTDFINSARSFFSKWFLHFLFYRSIVHYCLPNIEKVLSISKPTESFAKSFYDIPPDKLEFFPLGGRPVQDSEYFTIRERVRRELKLESDHIVFVQSGKQSSSKKLLETLTAFTASIDIRFRLFIVGSLLSDIREEAEFLINKDDRITFLGWKRPDQLRELLCAADVYMQPGSQSSTMQTSLCCYCVPVLSSIDGHEIYTKDNGWIVTDVEDIERVLAEISSGAADLEGKKLISKKLASEMLDYSVLAQRVLR